MPKISNVDITIPDASLHGRVLLPAADVQRTQCILESDVEIPVPLRSLFVHDSGALLGTTASADDLALSPGTLGTNHPRVVSSDSATASTTQYARAEVFLPKEYAAGETIQFKISADMQTIADTSATLDLQVYKAAGDGTVGADLCSTAAQSINSATATDYTFVVSSGGLSPSDQLDVRLTVAIVDGATGSGVVARINNLRLTADIRG